MNRDKEPKEPIDTPINIEKQVKKSAVGWLVPALLGIMFLGLAALAKSQVSNMLLDYQTNKQAISDRVELQHQAEVSRAQLQGQIDAYRAQVSDMQTTLIIMDKKLDHLQYVWDYAQQHGRLASPKDSIP